MVGTEDDFNGKEALETELATYFAGSSAKEIWGPLFKKQEKHVINGIKLIKLFPFSVPQLVMGFFICYLMTS